MACTLCVGVHLCARHHPPLVTFLLCLLTLAATFLGFGVYVRSFPVRDADFTEDFDTVLQALSSAAICPQRNASAHEPVQAADLSNVSVLTSITLSPWQPSTNYSGLQIRATASQLGMKGSGSDPHLLLTVSSRWWSAQCNDSDAECSGKFCVIVTGPQSALPLRMPHAMQCSAGNPSGLQLLPELYVVEGKSPASSKCYSVQYTEDPHQKAMMSPEDSSRSSVRLLVAMLFCLLLALMLFVVSACWIHPMKDRRTPGPL